MKRKNSLHSLLPYLSRYRSRMTVGALMVVLTVAAGMLSPWVWKYVVDDIQAAFAREKLAFYGILIIGIALLEGFFRFWMRKILIGISRDIEFDLRNDFLDPGPSSVVQNAAQVPTAVDHLAAGVDDLDHRRPPSQGL
jgi:ABC-type multidrug transport system fused ATPase/permease subunit